MSSCVIGGRPMCLPFARAFATPLFTRERIMESSSSEKNRYQLQKRHRHGVRVSGSAVDGDTADDLEADMFYPDYLNDFAKLLDRP